MAQRPVGPVATLHMPPALRAELERRAAEAGVTFSEMTRRLLTQMVTTERREPVQIQ